MVENSIVIDNVENKEQLTLSSLVFEQSCEPPRLLRSRRFKTRIKIVPDYGYTSLFEEF